MRVNDSYLSKEDFYQLYDSTKGNGADSVEVINNWIKKELIWQKAVKEGLTGSTANKIRLDQIQKNFVYQQMIDKLAFDASEEIPPNELEAYFDANKHFYRLTGSASIVNYFLTMEEETAVKYRAEMVSSGWESVRNVISGNPKVTIKEGEFWRDYELPNKEMSYLVGQMMPGEVSLIIKTADNRYMVFLLTSKLQAGNVPDLKLIRSTVMNDLIVQKRLVIEKEIIEKLTSENTIEIK